MIQPAKCNLLLMKIIQIGFHLPFKIFDTSKYSYLIIELY
jgi:hypothetical protein